MYIYFSFHADYFFKSIVKWSYQIYLVASLFQCDFYVILLLIGHFVLLAYSLVFSKHVLFNIHLNPQTSNDFAFTISLLFRDLVTTEIPSNPINNDKTP